MLVLAVLVICLSQVSVYCQRTGPEVKTSAGLVVGLDVDHSNTTGAVYRAFLGVPYGNKPVRFQLPQRRSPWSGPLYAQQDGLPCPQPNIKNISGLVYSEDCLNLNVFTPPNSTSESKWPVLVYVYGGGFLTGSSNSSKYGPDFLIGQGVVVVTFNYRMGAVGFLTLGSSIAPGNLALHDALLLLKWVRQEIAMFGGDPSRVTLGGHSSGSTTVNFLILSPLSYDDGPLFSQVIMLSGSAMGECELLSVTQALKEARLLAQALNCDNTTDDLATLSCLQAADIQHIVGNQTLIPRTTQDCISWCNKPFYPVLDDSSMANRPVFNASLDELTKEVAKRNIPTLLGLVRDEGSVVFEFKTCWILTEKNLDMFIPPSMANKLKEEGRRSTFNKIRDRYFPGGPDENKIASLVDLYGDLMIKYNVIKNAHYFRNSTYAYVFEYYGSWKKKKPFFSEVHLEVIKHADDLPYIWYGFGHQYLDDCRDNLPNLRMRDLMVQMITDFIKTGNPSNGSIPWQRLSQTNQYLVINYELSTVNGSEMDRKHFDLWADIENTVSSSSTNFFLSTTLLLVIFNFNYIQY